MISIHSKKSNDADKRKTRLNLRLDDKEFELLKVPHCQNSCHLHLNNPNGGKGDNHGAIQSRTQTSNIGASTEFGENSTLSILY